MSTDVGGETGVNSGFLRGQIIEKSKDKLTPPKNIIQTIEAAKALYWQARTEHLKRIELYAQIEGLIAGNPPYNPTELAQAKLSHIANFNNLDARALYERGALAYWNLLNETETICKFFIRGDDPELLDFADTMSYHWDEVVRSWPSFNVVFNTLAGQLVKFGISPVLWPDERDWRWRTIELSRFFVQDQAQSDIEKVTYVCVESVFTAQFLYEVYNQFKDTPKDETPWNIEELSNLLLFLANTTYKQDFEFYDLMDIQRRIQNGDLTFNMLYTDDIRIASLFYQEYDGKVSHYMFNPRNDWGEFLYFADRQYKCLDEGIIIFTASPGEFTIHSNRGLGHKIFSSCQAMMQLDCSIIDMARMSSTPLLKTLATGAKDFEQIRFYPGVPTNIGTTEVIQNTLGENINQLIGASQYCLQKVQFNTANSGDDPSTPDRSHGSISPTQARMQSYKEFAVLKNNIAHFYSQLDRVFQNMVVKMLNSKDGDPGYEYVKEWKDRCIADGVPEILFSVKDTDQFGMPKFLKVKATRAAGDGSTLAKIMGLQELQVIAGDFGPREAREYKRQWIMAVLGPEYVPAFLQDSDDADEAAGGASLAAVENGIMKFGEAPVFSLDNEQRSHFVTHLALGNDTIRRIQQQQMSSIDADKIFTVLIPHMQEHFQALQRSVFAEKFVQQLKKPWEQLQEYARLNRKNAASQLQAQIRKQQEQQAQTQQVLNDEQLKNMQVQGEERRKDYKVQQQVERAREANETRGDVAREKVREDASTSRLKVQLESEVNAMKVKTNNLENRSLPELRDELSSINGQTPSPYDIEA